MSHVLVKKSLLTIADGDAAPEVDAPTRKIIDHLEANPFLDPENMSPAEMREAFDAYYATVDLPPAPVQAEDMDFKGRGGAIRARIYHPTGDRTSKLPVILFIRGGGLVMGSFSSYDGVCRRICQASQSIVVTIDYRQPPEHRHPAALEDCHDALQWIRKSADDFGGDSSRVAISGDSGGGMLAAVVTHLVRDNGEPALDYQALIYPAVGTRGDAKSMEEFAEGYVFDPMQLDWLYDQYLADPSQRNDPQVSPIFCDNLSDLPPALVVTAHFDIFRDDAENYGRLMAQAGTSVEIKRYPTVIHGFIQMGRFVPAAGEALDYCGARLAEAFEKANASAV